MGQKIVPHLWFAAPASQAAEFYATAFPNSKVTATQVRSDTPIGDVEMVSFEVMGYGFESVGGASEGGGVDQLNPSISMMVNFDPSQDADARQQIDEVWHRLLADGGMALMPLQEYPFSEHYGWVQDRFNMTWQLIYTQPEGDWRPPVMPAFLFVGDVCGQAEAASDCYLSLFEDSKRGELVRWPAGMEPETEGHIMFTDFCLAGQWFMAQDSGNSHDFGFNEAVSLMVRCQDQAEIDYFWEGLTADGGQESQCGWLKDRFGVSWQIVPENMGELMERNPEKTLPAMLGMKKLVIAELLAAGDG